MMPGSRDGRPVVIHGSPKETSEEWWKLMWLNRRRSSLNAIMEIALRNLVKPP